MKGKKIFIIPDAQVKEGVPIDHLLLAGKYIVDKRPEIVICLGDWWDMPSLSSYEKSGSKYFEGKRYKKDVEAGNKAMQLFLSPLKKYNAHQRKNKKKKWSPKFIFLLGNHEDRVRRAIEADPVHLEGIIGYQDFNFGPFKVYDYMEIVMIEGIMFSHCFANPFSVMKGALTGTIDNKLQKLGGSFVMGHQQQLQFGVRNFTDGRQTIGIVAGAYYQHHEDYLGKQGNDHWRGCIVLHDTQKGYGDIMVLSMKYMKEEYQ